MKRKDIVALHSKIGAELKSLEKEIALEISKLKKELIEKKLKNTSLIRLRQDDLARVKTVLSHHK
jgi:ribosomal protein L29